MGKRNVDAAAWLATGVQLDVQKPDQLSQARAKALISGKKPDITAAKVLSQLPSTRRAKAERRLAQMPPKCRPAYLKAISGKSRNAAIRAFCAECVGWEGLPNSVRHCTALACPLFSVRPGACHE